MHSSSQHTDCIGINSNISAQVNVEKESAPVPQWVLGEAFCINRLNRILKLAGNERLKDLMNGSNRDDREKKISSRDFYVRMSRVGPLLLCFSRYTLEVDTYLQRGICHKSQSAEFVNRAGSPRG